MGKKSRTKSAPPTGPGGIGPRQPCPCGSGRRYKACHGAANGDLPYVVRTFGGLPGECDWVALREFVPAGQALLTLQDDAYDGAAAGQTVRVCTVLPGIAPALRRDDGEVWIAAQVAHQSADPSTDLAEALRLGMVAEPGESVAMPQVPPSQLRLQDVVEESTDFPVTVLDGFDFWFEGSDDEDGTVAATLEQLNSSIDPTTRLEGVSAAYWTSVGTKEHLRWVLPYDEESLLTALARLHAADDDRLGPDSRLVGSFRAHGLLVPVWDLPVGTGAEAVEEPAQKFAERLEDALASGSALTPHERAARNGLANRQLTIR